MPNIIVLFLFYIFHFYDGTSTKSCEKYILKNAKQIKKMKQQTLGKGVATKTLQLTWFYFVLISVW